MPMSNSNGRRKICKCVLTQPPCLFLLTEPSWGIPTPRRPWRHRLVKLPAVLVPCTGHWLLLIIWTLISVSGMLQTCYLDLAVFMVCKHCYEVMGWYLRIKRPAQQQAEEREGIHVLELCEPWSSPHTLSQLCTGQLYFSLLGTEGNVFGGVGIDYWPSHLGNFPS